MSSSRICVAVRKKPASEGEKDIVVVQSPSCVINEPKVKYDLTHYTDRHTFVYDEVMDETVGNREVYQRCCQPLIETVFSYGNATCFAYGQTGSGKTHTMLGRADEPGLYACAARDVFMRARAINADVLASFYEIYGRKLFDLLNERTKVVAREDADKVINICGLTEHPVRNIEDLFNIISSGSSYRAAGSTSANADSSRSHAVLQLEVREQNNGKTVGRISFIDLAGNERGADTLDCDRKTRMEGAEINKSLLALKECIRALGMGKSHVPFRGSVLTEVLRDSFLGNSRTTMIATISPNASHCENSLNTLRYTQRVKEFGGGAPPVQRQQIVEEKRRPAPEPKAGRRKAPPPALNRPEWVDDFNDASALDAPLKPARRAPNPSARKNVVVKDPHIATIVKHHMEELDEDELSPTDDDDEEEAETQAAPAAAPSVSPPPSKREQKQVRAVHAHVVRSISKAEDSMLQLHRKHIDFKMSCIREEIAALRILEDTDTVEEYVSRVVSLFTKQQKDLAVMMQETLRLQGMLKEEEELLSTLTPSHKKNPRR